MKRKLLITFIMSFMLPILLIGCGKGDRDTEKGIDYLKNLESYSCNLNIIIQNDKQTINYEGKQTYDKKYGYRFELDNNRVFIYKDDKIFVKDLQNGLKYDTDKDFDSVFKVSFIGEYIGMLYTNEEVKTFFKSVDNNEFQVIHLDLPGNNKNISKADLYINAKDNIPKYLYIYDSKDNKRITIEYYNFMANLEVEKNLFEIQ